MTTQITIADLEALGFMPAQIARLVELRDAYPYLEHYDAEQWRRLQFLRWRVRHQQVTV